MQTQIESRTPDRIGTSKRWLLPLFVGLALLASGCGSHSSSSRQTAAPAASSAKRSPTAQAATLRRKAAARARLARLRAAARRAALRAAVPAGLTTYRGGTFTIGYPSGWRVESAEVAKSTYLDTTIRSRYETNRMLRVDILPVDPSADAVSLAQQVRAQLTPQPGYQELDFSTTGFHGYDAVRWEFLVSERGLLLHKVDTILVDGTGNDIAILTQTPAAEYGKWEPLLERARDSFQLAGGSPPATPPAQSFCDTHACIANFDNGTGTIVQCADGMWSHSGGHPGACSYHGGEAGSGGSNSSGSSGSSSGGGGNGYAVTCNDGTTSYSGGIQGACSHHGGVAP